MENTQTLAPSIDKEIEGAKQAIQEINWILQGHDHVRKMIEAQLEYAQEMLTKLEDEKSAKYQSAD